MNNVELRDYLSEKIDINFQHTTQLLQSIQEQTTKTNGRVSALEVQVWTVVRDEINHEVNCPGIVRVIALEKENEEIRMIKKYPKVALGVLVIFVAISLISIYLGYSKLENQLNIVHTTQQIILNEKESLMKK